MSAHWVWMVVALYCSAAWVATTWIRVRYGHDGSGVGSDAGPRRHGRDGGLLRDELRARELDLARLEARVRVLERIATDRRTELEREFARLAAED